jgi:hypothetical protein
MAKAGNGKASKSSKGKIEAGSKKASTTKALKSKAAKTKASKKGIVPLTPEFVDDLKKVFAKHNWSGHPIGFVANPAATSLGIGPCDPGPTTCPDGSTPLQQWVHCPDGTSILRNYCP